jgi:SAM-dependent methyltransferase
MAGFSKRADVQEAIDKAHADLEATVAQYLQKGDSILDIGCGAGAYLAAFTANYKAVGIDLSEDMISVAKQHLPDAEWILSDFMNYKFDRKFKFIYSVSVLEFIPPSALVPFLKKVYDLLEPGGMLYLNYPHALSKKVLLYPDLYYIEYAPREVEESLLRQPFEILKHEQAFDGRKISTFDPQPYMPGTRTFKNGYLLVAQRPEGTPKNESKA